MWRRWVFLTAAVTVVAGCGGVADAPHVPGAAGGTSGTSAYERCIEQFSAPKAAPSAGGTLASPLSAQEACRSLLSGAASQQATVPLDEQNRLLRWAACMRQHGIDVHDPVFDNGSAKFGVGTGVNPDSDAYRAAAQTCFPLQQAGPSPSS